MMKNGTNSTNRYHKAVLRKGRHNRNNACSKYRNLRKKRPYALFILHDADKTKGCKLLTGVFAAHG